MKCILWQGAVNNKGYGLLNVNGRVALVHRIAFKLANPQRRIDRMLILHRCDVRRCINPAHPFRRNPAGQLGRHAPQGPLAETALPPWPGTSQLEGRMK
jgi:hypothetical protein